MKFLKLFIEHVLSVRREDRSNKKSYLQRSINGGLRRRKGRRIMQGNDKNSKGREALVEGNDETKLSS